MSTSKIELTILFSGILFVILFFNFFVANGQNTNSANIENINTNTNIETNQAIQTDNKNGEKKDPAVESEDKEAETSPTPCDPNSNLTISQVYEDVEVTNAYKHKDRDLPRVGPNEKTKTIELGDTIVVEVKNLKLLLNRKECLASEGEDKEIVLFLDNRPLINNTENPPVDPTTGRIHFTLVRNEDTRDVWTYLLEMPRWQTSKTKVSIGFEDAYAVKADDDAFINLTVIPHGWSIFWLIVIIIFLIGFIFMARNTNIIRSPGLAISSDHWLPYSLGRTQAAWWFFIILASYLFIGVITGDFNTTITSTVLSLFGISAGTAVSSAFVDANRDTETNRQKNLREATVIEHEVKKLDDNIQKSLSGQKVESIETDTKPKSLMAIEEQKEDKTAKVNKLRGISTGFFADILTDKDGISFHRFQTVALSIVLGFIFIYQVYAKLAMPEFSGTLLTLLLISSGTYLGFKLPQEK